MMMQYFKTTFQTAVFFFLVTRAVSSQPRDIRFERISLQDGLSQSTIRCIFQGSKGFMWFGTWDGLNRYDGYRFKVYKHNPEDPKSLSDKAVLSIAEDRWGGLWIGTGDGLNRFDREKETFTHFKNEPDNLNSLCNNAVWSICLDKSGALWIATMGGLDRLVVNRGRESEANTSRSVSQTFSYSFTHYKHDPANSRSLSSNQVKKVYEDHRGFLWVGTWNAGLNRFSPATEIFTRYQYQRHNPNSLSSYDAVDICGDVSGNMWVATNQGLDKLILSADEGFNPQKQSELSPSFTHYKTDAIDPNSLIDNYVLTVCTDRSGVLWIGTKENGLNRFDPQKEEFTRYQHDPGDPNSLSHDGVYSIYEDRTGVLWFGTFGGGINKYYPKQKNFSHYKVEPGNPNSLSHNFVTTIHEDKSGALWIGTWDGGLNKIVRSEKGKYFDQYTHFKNESGNPNSLSGNIVLAIHEDRAGTFWIGTWGDGFNKFDPRLNRGAPEQFTRYNFGNKFSDASELNKVLSFTEDRAGALWLHTGGAGVVKFEPKTEEFTFYRNEPQNPNSLSDDNVTCIHKDKSGAFWIGTMTGGLNKLLQVPVESKQGYPQFQNKFIHYKNDPEDANSLSHNNVSTIFEDQAGVLWIGTNGGGLNRFAPPASSSTGGEDVVPPRFIHYMNDPANPMSLNGNHVGVIYEDKAGNLWIEANGLNRLDRKTGSFTRYSELANVDIRRIYEDGNGNLWLCTTTGISKFDPENETIRNFDVSDGLQSKEFNNNAQFRSSSEIFIGGVNGLNSFFPDSIKDNPHPSEIAITNFQISNISVPIGAYPLPASITETKEIVLSYRDRVFSFEFAALHYANPAKNKYAYKMEGLDEEWNYIGARRFAMFTNLSPGEYTFRVKGSNCDGVWDGEGTSIKISITPPPWKTWWAYSLYLISFGAIIFGFIRFATNRALLKSKLDLEHNHAEKLEELDRIKSRFFANISHEFRTPLTLILGPLENLLAESYDNKLKKQFKLMQRNGQRLLLLINQLLDLSKMEAGSMSLKTRPENIVQLIKNTVLFFSSMAERKQIDLRFNSSQEKIIVYVDRDKLEKIVSNLLSNAFKFTPEGGEISVAVSSGAGEKGCRGERENIIEISPAPLHPSSLAPFVEIQVIDSGVGIPPDRIDKIFNRFYQATEGSTYPTGQEGTGIGLALAKELVELHRGEITVESPPPNRKTGQGTVFTIRLPLGMAHLNPDEIIAPVQEISLEEKKSRIEPLESIEISEDESIPQSLNDGEVILIVEDNPDIRAYVRDFLEKTYQVIEACDGVEGFDMAAEKIPDMIISDVMMPKMDGLEFCRKIKTDERTSHIPVILLTARASGDNKLAGLEIGADDYLTKPFDARELLVRIKNLINQRRKLRERFSREITVQPKDITITSMDEEFLQRAMAIVEKHISDPEFTTETFAWEIGLSRNQLNLKLRALTDQPTHGFIRMLRLKRAAQLLQQGAGTVSEIVYDVGFNNLSHFAKAFRQQFGQSPSEFAASHAQDI